MKLTKKDREALATLDAVVFPKYSDGSIRVDFRFGCFGRRWMISISRRSGEPFGIAAWKYACHNAAILASVRADQFPTAEAAYNAAMIAVRTAKKGAKR